MFRIKLSGVTLIECLIAFVFLMSGVGTALYAAKRFGWLGGLLGFFVGSFGCWAVLLLAAFVAVIAFGLFNGLPEFPVCGNGRCKFRIFMGTDDYHYEKIDDDVGVRCRCGLVYVRAKGTKQVLERLPDGTLRPYMVWKPLRGWYPDSGGTINPSETHPPPV